MRNIKFSFLTLVTILLFVAPVLFAAPAGFASSSKSAYSVVGKFSLPSPYEGFNAPLPVYAASSNAIFTAACTMSCNDYYLLALNAESGKLLAAIRFYDFNLQLNNEWGDYNAIAYDASNNLIFVSETLCLNTSPYTCYKYIVGVSTDTYAVVANFTAKENNFLAYDSHNNVLYAAGLTHVAAYNAATDAFINWISVAPNTIEAFIYDPNNHMLYAGNNGETVNALPESLASVTATIKVPSMGGEGLDNMALDLTHNVLLVTDGYCGGTAAFSTTTDKQVTSVKDTNVLNPYFAGQGYIFGTVFYNSFSCDAEGVAMPTGGNLVTNGHAVNLKPEYKAAGEEDCSYVLSSAALKANFLTCQDVNSETLKAVGLPHLTVTSESGKVLAYVNVGVIAFAYNSASKVLYAAGGNSIYEIST